MKVTTPRIVLIRRPTFYVAALGALAFATTVACSDDPAPGLGTAGTSPGVSGSNPGVGGTGVLPMAGTGGAPVGTSGTGFGNGGTPAAGGSGTAGTATGGAGGTGTGGTGTGGTANGGTGGVYVPPPPYCDTAADSTLPFVVTSAFYASAWQGLYSQITATSTVDYCAAGMRPAGAQGGCSRWTVTPDALAPAWTAVAWVNRADANFTHDKICLAPGAKRISFYARGAVGGEKLSCGGAGVGAAGEAVITLTNAWKEYSVPLTGVDYNNANDGVPSGFSWKVEPMVGDTAPVVFAIDNIQFVSTDAGGGGTGGAGGAGGAGGSGGSSAGAGGTTAGTGGTSAGTGGGGGTGGI